MRRSLLVVPCSLLLCAPAPAAAAEGDIIVQRASGADRRQVREDAGVQLVKALPLERTELVEPEPGETLGEALAALDADPDVVYAEPDRTATIARDTFFGELWALDNPAGPDIDALLAWDHSRGEGVTVAVVDTGVNAEHVDLQTQLVAGWDFVSGDRDPQDGHGHGTHVAGTIAAADDGEGIVGVAPQARLMPLRALGNTGTGSMSAIAAAFDYAGKHGARIVNASLGGAYSQAVRDAIAAHPDTLFVVAAGNDAANADTDAGSFPCALPEPNVVCVGASDDRDAPATFSNYGATAVDLYAPGVDILSTYRGSPTAYAALSGTSMAAPHVAGTAALALAVRADASTAFLRSTLLASVDARPALAGLAVTGGRLNAGKAVTTIMGGEVLDPAPTPAPVETPAPTPQAPVAEAPAAPPVPPAPQATPPLAISKLQVSKGKVSFRLSRPGALKLTFKRGGKRIATRTVTGKAGANTLKLPVRRAGSYTLTVAAGAVIATRMFRITSKS